jgi:hypothetical protein
LQPSCASAARGAWKKLIQMALEMHLNSTSPTTE